MELEGRGAVSIYWHPDSADCAAVAATIECLRACAAPQVGGWEKVKVE
ncbi:hypothetical protein LGM43_08595 [Burkholderia seminalis]|nr:hypothetical protein [Burkholderia seminalis]MCA7950328.1 hypothetical protein [Burkholderia seminalis]MDN7588969.1 hypothetical protein [Burkholderia seminalis]